MQMGTDTGRILGVHWTLWLIGLIGCSIGFAYALSSSAHAQHTHGHAQFHEVYQDWVNKEKVGCCNNQDCKPLKESHERVGADGEPEVFITGVGVAAAKSSWCKVLPRHYLSKGNAPNWGTAHVCVTGRFNGQTPCEQFICYQPKPQV